MIASPNVPLPVIVLSGFLGMGPPEPLPGDSIRTLPAWGELHEHA
ncbi:hypothetical protein [Nocardia vaccinii]|nr:hypothetical protein [Nocardia vaccinii]